MTTHPAADLPVPDEAREALAFAVGFRADNTEQVVRAIARPVVAAELRRLAAYVATHVKEARDDGDPRYAEATEDITRHLRARADQLDR